MDDLDDMLDMEAEMELEEQMDLLGELEEEEKSGKGTSPKRRKVGGGEAAPASLGMTQELEQLVGQSVDPETERAELTENELQELAATQGDDNPSDEDCEEEEESFLPVRYLYQTEGRDHVSVTLEGGKRVYCTVNGEQREKKQVAGRKRKGKTGGFLAVPVRQLIEQVERKRVQKIIQESENLSKSVDGADLSQAKRADVAGEKLLVSKYAPRRFIELLSDEQTNREVVRWLKLWDHYVFGKEQVKPAKPKREEAGSFLSKNEWLKTGNDKKKSSRAGNAYTNEALDKDGRPSQKVLLFCGPPGFGKTTLAHIAAKQCGYRTVEVNASDDRNAGALNKKIMDAMQMQSMKDGRPTCLVIDEIDGAMGGSDGKGAINMLVQLINAKRSDASTAAGVVEGEGSSRRKGKGKKADILTRPVICICNDLYANALRPLRDVARIFHFKKPDSRKISARLRRICQLEKIEAEGNALGILSQKSDGDIRSCLNTLEFLQRQQQKLSMSSLHAMGIGAKDKVDNVFHVMESVFNTNSKLGEADGGPSTSVPRASFEAKGGASKKRQRVTQFYQKLMNFGETDLLLTSCFENLSNVKYQDINLVKTSQAAEWFVFADEMSKGISDLNDFSLNKFRVAAPIALNTLASAPGRPQLTWAKVDGNARYQHRVQESVLHSWMSNLQPAAKSGMNTTTAVLDVIPHLCKSLVPRGLRPVAPELMRAKERVTLKRIVDHLVSYGLSLKMNKQGGDSDGNFRMSRTSYSLQPEIDKFHRYEGLPSNEIYMNSAVKQIITYEQETRKIRSKREAGVKESLEDKVKSKPKDSASKNSGGEERKKHHEHWLSKMRTAVENKQELRRMGGKKGGTICREVAYPMLYTYHEGVTNAVKRRVVLKELV
ncbi:P-loop-containing nucleoside triphosphate hydrolase [Chloropicon primus]|nr:P-loop-containing nucleoside triphosphate hydrolase [Chloropicon primus]